MGGAVSVIAPTLELMSPRMWADPEARRLWEVCEVQLRFVCATERDFLIGQKDVMFRKHPEIIRVLMGKTKKQLKQIVNGKVPGPHLTQDEIEAFGSGPYATFLRTCCLSEVECRIKELDLAIGGVGCHEDRLVAALAGCTSPQLSAVKLYRNKPLAALVEGKTKAGSHLQNFLLRILTLDRDDESNSNVDAEAALSQARTIYENGAAHTFGVNEDPIFDIICKASRAQCTAIDAAYQELHQATLSAAFEYKFSGAVRLGLALWVQPSPEAAAAYLLHYLTSGLSCDSTMVGRILARYEKPALTEIDGAYKSFFNQSLSEMISHALSGNLAKAATAWISLPTPDGGNEALVAAKVAEQLVWQGEKDIQSFLFEMAGTQKVCDELLPLLIAQNAAIDDYMKAFQHEEWLASHAAANSNPRRSQVTQQRASVISLRSNHQARRNAVSGKMISQKMPSSKIILEVGGDLANELLLTEEFLLLRFHECDPSSTGVLAEDEFWSSFYQRLPLLELGFTSDEMDAMCSWVEWEHGGSIAFDDIKEELADSIMDAIHAAGKNVQQVMSDLIAKSSYSSASGEQSDSAAGDDENEKLSPDLVGYLADTFRAYDVDGNNELDYEEFWQLINAMNLGITAADYVEVQARWDGDRNGRISWREAIHQFNAILGSMITDGQDHWIGLVDQETQNLFWLNLADSTSQWMTEEDCANFKAHAVVVEEQAAAVSHSQPMPARPAAVKKKGRQTLARVASRRREKMEAESSESEPFFRR